MTDIPGNQPPQGYPPQPYPPQQYPPQQYPPPYPPGYYPPPKKGPSALKIVLIIVGILVGLGIIGVGIAGYGVYRLAKSGNLTSSNQPVTASELGVALYPGAEQQANVHATVLGKSVLTATFLTSDAKDQVVTFYQNALGTQAQVQTILNETQLTLNTGASGLVTVKISSGMGVESGKTRIVITHATDAATPSQ
jgi:flagellar basal body-associated protein FliL